MAALDKTRPLRLGQPLRTVGTAVLRTYVTTPTPGLARLAARRGATVILEPAADDLNGAFERGRRCVAAGDPATSRWTC